MSQKDKLCKLARHSTRYLHCTPSSFQLNGQSGCINIVIVTEPTLSTTLPEVNTIH